MDRGDGQAPRTSWGLIRDPRFGPFFLAKSFWATGMWVFNISAAIFVFERTGSVFLVGLVSVAHFSPQLLLSAYSGARADRGDRRGQAILGRALGAAATSALVLWHLTLGLDGPSAAWIVIAAAGVVGVGDALGAPATHAVLPTLVRPGELPAAVALDVVPFTAARAVGPAIGALLTAWLGVQAAFLFNAASGFLFAWVLARVVAPSQPPTDGRARSTVRAGFRYVRGHPILALLIVGVGVVGFGSDPVMTLTPAVADRLGGDADLVGILASAFGLGAASVFLVLGRLRLRYGLPRVASVGILCLSVGWLLLGVASVTSVAIAATALAGAGYTMAVSAFTGLLQQTVEEAYRGRVMAFWTLAFLGSRPLAAAMNGAIADVASVGVALAATAAIVVIGGLISRPSRLG